MIEGIGSRTIQGLPVLAFTVATTCSVLFACPTFSASLADAIAFTRRERMFQPMAGPGWSGAALRVPREPDPSRRKIVRADCSGSAAAGMNNRSRSTSGGPTRLAHSAPRRSWLRPDAAPQHSSAALSLSQSATGGAFDFIQDGLNAARPAANAQDLRRNLGTGRRRLEPARIWEAEAVVAARAGRPDEMDAHNPPATAP